MMTQQEQVSAVLEKMGWSYKECFEHSFADSSKQVSRGFKWHNSDGIICRPPDLLHSLDEIAQVRGVLGTLTERITYLAHLLVIVQEYGDVEYALGLLRKEGVHFSAGFNAVNATPAQHLEALCRTWWPEKWK